MKRAILLVFGCLLGLPLIALSSPKDDVCKDGTWQIFGFETQGMCIKAINHGEVMVWSLGNDFPRYPNNVNPAPDQYGHSDVWHYRYSIGLSYHPDGYFYYTDYLMDWSGIEEAWTAGTVNESYSPLLGVASYAKGAVLHPTRDSFSVASWRSPIEGIVGVKGSFQDVQPGCGNGASWAIVHEIATQETYRDQGQVFGTEGEIELGTDTWSQSIMTGLEGQLVGIEFQMHWGSFPGTFDFALISGGNPPVGPVLYSEQVTISQEDLDDQSLFTWDLSPANLHFGAGQVFTFVFSAQDSGFNIAGNDPPGYLGGELFKNGNALSETEVNDLGFISYVETGPTRIVLRTLAEGVVASPAGNRNERFDFNFDIPMRGDDYLDFAVGPAWRENPDCDTTSAVITLVGPLAED
ncbi:MAG: hypothetical protein KJO09_09960 [Gammaproteobacteria bacterium]|nr:hypothetical protein [Gammaproteobacteria bacterium]